MHNIDMLLRKCFLITMLVSTIVSCLSLDLIEKDSDWNTIILPRGSDPAAQNILWSPVNEDVVMVFASGLPSTPVEIYLYNIALKQKTVLVKEQPAFLLEAIWLPDGQHIAFSSTADMPGYQPAGWWLMNIKTREMKYFLPPGDVSISPDGKLIATIRETIEDNITTRIDLFLIDMVTKEERLVYTDFDMDYSGGISWSPDSKFVVFSLYRPQVGNLYIFDVEVGNIKEIITGAENVAPSWSPQGNIIAYVHWNSMKHVDEIYLIQSNGGCNQKVPSLEKAWSPSWSPDGKKLGYVGVDGIYFVAIDEILGRDIYEGLCE